MQPTHQKHHQEYKTAPQLWGQTLSALQAHFPDFGLEWFAQLDSTSSELMRRVHAGRYEHSVVVAGQQTAGRGRMGKTWFSLGDALSFSVGMPYHPQSWAGLSLALGLSIAKSLDPEATLGLKVKWPNDIWLQGCKLAGILIETVHAQGTSAKVPYVVVGIGMNVCPPEHTATTQALQGLNPPPTYFQTLQANANVPQTFAQILPVLLADLAAFAHNGFAPLLADFAKRDALYGQPIVCSDGNYGLAQGVNAEGALLLQVDKDVMRPVVATDVSIRLQ